mmetsp:Transcript_108236/g.311837  ORF Transcript_108236/g.311837 Transcript_108236/m.311837 type:complete len:442 (+) Transcript_108236:83-1408(+)
MLFRSWFGSLFGLHAFAIASLWAFGPTSLAEAAPAAGQDDDDDDDGAQDPGVEDAAESAPEPAAEAHAVTRAPVAATVSSNSEQPAGVSKSGGGGKVGGIDFDSLQSSLKTGGAEGLENMLESLKMMKEAQKTSDIDQHIMRDESGQMMYDFRNLGPTAAPAKPAKKTPAPLHKKLHGVPGISDHESEAVPPLPGRSSGPVQPPITVAAAPPPERASEVDPAMAGAQGVPMVAPPTGPTRLSGPEPSPPAQEPAMALRGSAGQGSRQAPQPSQTSAEDQTGSPVAAAPAVVAAQGEEVGRLARGLAEVRARIDELAAEAEQAAGGAPPQEAPRSRVPPTPVAAPSAVIPPKVEAEIQDLIHRVGALEAENKELRGELETHKGQLKLVEAAQHAETLAVNHTQAQDAELQANVTFLMKEDAFRKRHLRKVRHVRHMKPRATA